MNTDLFFVPTSADETFPTSVVLSNFYGDKEFVGTSIGCKTTSNIDISDIRKKENKGWGAEVANALYLDKGISCYYGGGGDEYVLISGYSNNMKTIFHRSLDEVAGTGKWIEVRSLRWPVVNFISDDVANVLLSPDDVIELRSEKENHRIYDVKAFPNNKFIFYRTGSQYDPHGGNAMYIYDVGAKTAHQLTFVNEDEQYASYIDTMNSLYNVAMSGSFAGWVEIADTGTYRMLYTVSSVGSNGAEATGISYVLQYASVSADEPWVLEPSSI
jgi:hypothetical protein